MASAWLIQKAQVSIGCQLCESGSTIQWNCIDCLLLMCSKCKQIHMKFKNAINHKIVDINESEPREYSDKNFNLNEINCQDHAGQACCLYCKDCKQFICFKCMTKVHKGHETLDTEKYKFELDRLIKIQRETKNKLCTMALFNFPRKIGKDKFGSEKKEVKVKQSHLNFKITGQFTSDIKRITSVSSCSGDSLWIGNWGNEVKHVNLTKDEVQVISQFTISLYDMPVTSSDNILLSVGESSLKNLNEITGQLSDSKYNVAPMLATGVHVTTDQKVIIGAITQGAGFTGEGKRMVIVMDKEGKSLTEYEQDKHNKPLFTFPDKISCTRGGNICVIDRLDGSNTDRVVVLGQAGHIIGVYSGHPDINYPFIPFKPSDILTTTLHNIIIADKSMLHILNCDGQIISYCRMDFIGIM
ncbi:unnamed protein product [Mytilus coruscus]|uniref:B box-type domain-containing protein n=1 Tax=Mytilus coruscus TaxID=42192 RepID=A0A6J8EMG6_MYTCO|nr:unnamed protein product [Mytilus coruscus]